MDGLIVTIALDKWHWNPKQKKIQDELIESSNMCNEENHFIGLPCKNWQKITDAIFTHSNCTSSKYMSYTTVFVNRNYNRFKEWVLKYINSKNRRKIILIANSIINKDISWADQFFPVYNNLIDNWETDGTELINNIFCFCLTSSKYYYFEIN